MKPFRQFLLLAGYCCVLFCGAMLSWVKPILCPLLILIATMLCLKGWFLEGLVITFAAWVAKEK